MNHQMPPSKEEFLCWTVRNPEPNAVLRGWVYGERFGCATHHDHVTRPCRKKLTSSTLECQYCIAGMKESWTGWLPWIDSDGEKCVAMYSRYLEPAVSQLALGQPIELTKGKFKTARVIIRSKSWTVAPCPYLGRLRLTPDIRPFLLLLWKDEALKKEFGMKPAAIPLPDSMLQAREAVPEARMTGEEVSTMIRNRIKNWGPDSKPNSTDEVFPEARPKKNGKH